MQRRHELSKVADASLRSTPGTRIQTSKEQIMRTSSKAGNTSSTEWKTFREHKQTGRISGAGKSAKAQWRHTEEYTEKGIETRGQERFRIDDRKGITPEEKRSHSKNSKTSSIATAVQGWKANSFAEQIVRGEEGSPEDRKRSTIMHIIIQ